MQKLGFIQQKINQVSNTQIDHEKAIIDGLCDAIRGGQTVADFITLLKRLYQEELKHAHHEEQQQQQALGE